MFLLRQSQAGRPEAAALENHAEPAIVGKGHHGGAKPARGERTRRRIARGVSSVAAGIPGAALSRRRISQLKGKACRHPPIPYLEADVPPGWASH
ncbi:MAG TPA: hypothetical protein PL033_17730 [Candidatus Brocadiia bacterium]|nr:hypothetical protein [Candidatus Brocadiia bacterium]